MPMTKVARLLGAAGAGLSLMQDLRSLQQSWTHLEEGAKAETAEELRAVAGALEQELDQLTQRYELIIWRQGQLKSPLLSQEVGKGAQGPCGHGPPEHLGR